jgi:hypothetical protein
MWDSECCGTASVAGSRSKAILKFARQPSFAALLEVPALEGRRRMIKRSRRAVPSALQFALLFLAFAVFNWGLQARLSLINAHPSPSKISSTKLSTGKRSPKSTVSLKVVKEPIGTPSVLRLIAFTTFHDVLSSPAFKLHQVEVSLCGPCRFDSRSSSLMNRPPPTLV